MKALVVEDEFYNFESLRKMILRAYPQIQIDGPVTNLVDLERAMLNQQQYDVIYCDIRLEDGVCFSVLEGMAVNTPIIFTTAYSEFALKAFQSNGIAYLLKPVKSDELCKATDKALSMRNEKQNIAAILESNGLKGRAVYLHYLKANVYNGSCIIGIADVSYFVADEKRSYAMMADGTKYTINYTLEQLMQRLDPMQFFRANRQYIVNRSAISRIQTYGNRQVLIRLKGYDDVQVLISKEKVPVLNSWIEQ